MDDRKVEVVPYDKDWLNLFNAEAERIAAALGGNCVEVHHIGSTAIPELEAKPVIDMIPVVKNICEVDTEAMEALGYEVLGEFGMPFRRFFTKYSSEVSCHIHIYEIGNSEIERHLKFRDYMRTNDKARQGYGELKCRLAKEFPNSVLDYCMGKDAFVAEIDAKAGFNGERMVEARTDSELEAYHHLRKTLLFDQHEEIVYDPNHRCMIDPNQTHFVYRKGFEIVAIAQIEFLDEERAALRSIATKEECQRQGYGRRMLGLLERWVREQGFQVMCLHSAPEAEEFYFKEGYTHMEFKGEEPRFAGHIGMGKVL